MTTTTALHDRRILVIITGGIAAYKTLDLIRRLKEGGAKVRCVLTKGAEHFVTPLAVETLSGEKVYDDLWSLADQHKVGHISLARETDLVVVAPATANIIAKMAVGLADDLASTVLLATNKPVFIAPAMNVSMWKHPATQTNIETLAKRGVTLIGPECGSMACAEDGMGRMSEPMDIFAAIVSALMTKGALSGKKALVTSGPTFEPLDPVRFLGNRSSGKQGHAIAAALARAGADVTLVTGPCALPDPTGLNTIHIETAQEMLSACEENLPVDIVVCAAAVADWRPKVKADHKIKKGSTEPSVELIENPDILATLAHVKDHPPKLVIGFAAETKDLLANAAHKFQRKGCDWIVANDVANGKVFGEDENEATLMRQDASGQISSTKWKKQTKDALALSLVEEIKVYFKKENS